MEDTYAVYLNHLLHYSSARDRHLMSIDTEEVESEAVSPWALFGVYDGHGGEVSLRLQHTTFHWRHSLNLWLFHLIGVFSSVGF